MDLGGECWDDGPDVQQTYTGTNGSSWETFGDDFGSSNYSNDSPPRRGRNNRGGTRGRGRGFNKFSDNGHFCGFGENSDSMRCSHHSENSDSITVPKSMIGRLIGKKIYQPIIS